MAKQNGTRPSSGSSAITILIDSQCVRCDRTHTGECPISEKEWQESERCKAMGKIASTSAMIHFIRIDRAEKILGRNLAKG